jgi:hypothetical protein
MLPELSSQTVKFCKVMLKNVALFLFLST